jgi:hypothetical protein
LVARPDPDDLDRFMFETDAPYLRRLCVDGDLEVSAKGRSAIMLALWLRDVIAATNAVAKTPSVTPRPPSLPGGSAREWESRTPRRP